MSLRDGHHREVLHIFVQKMRKIQKRVKNVFFLLLFMKKGQTIFSIRCKKGQRK
jgi:hypothetical protein